MIKYIKRKNSKKIIVDATTLNTVSMAGIKNTFNVNYILSFFKICYPKNFD